MQSIFLLGCRTIAEYCNCSIQAIQSLKDKVIKCWPDSKEWSTIAKRIFEEYKFPNYVGFIDGTLFPLGFQPSSEDAPNYSGQKYGYLLSTLIVCDDQHMIQYFPGWLARKCTWQLYLQDDKVVPSSQRLFLVKWIYVGRFGIRKYMVYGECLQAIGKFSLAVWTRTFQSVAGRPMCLVRAYNWYLERLVSFFHLDLYANHW